ncbi:hypothetical protein [Epilithonimonas sp.]|uniref:hypothetical protein n=1 Tax=Epilithonimonas sp. TaxID=2894511 RepID=UPI0035AE0CE4
MMNIVEQYDANNTYYSINIPESTQFGTGSYNNIYFGSVDDSIYKTKFSFTDGVSLDASKRNNVVVFREFSPLFNGKLKIYNNPKKIKEIMLNIGISNYAQLGQVKNMEIDSAILDYFSECESFYFYHYCYSNTNTDIFKGKVTGEWATKCGSKLKKFEIGCADYPLTDATFNLNLIPSNSALEVLKPNIQSFIIVSGDLSHIPNTCKVVYLGSDKNNSTNSVSGAIPNWIEEFSRPGKNTISGNIAAFSPNLRFLHVEGSNTIGGNLANFPFLTTINVFGNNTIGGNLINVINATTITITGSNNITGVIPNFPNCKSFYISGNNELSGTIPVLQSMSDFSLSGKNTISGKLDMPNALSVTLHGQNQVSSLNLPKVTSVIISGQNIISGDLSAQINQSATNIQITGQNLISSVSNVFPDATIFIVTGKNLLTGNILDKCPKATNIQIGGENTITYTTRTFPSTMSVLEITGKAALTQQMVDRLLSDLNRDVSIWNGSKKITIKGNSEPPSSDSLSARNSLVLKGVTISTN